MCLSSNGANQLFVYLTAPRVLAHMPAWSASLITQVRTLPASLEYKCVCVCVWIGGWAWERMRVCTSICYNRGASCDRSPLTSALGEGACSCICGLLLLPTTDVLCSYASAYDHVQVFVLAWGPICLRLSFEEMPDSRPVKAPFPLLSPRHLFRNQMGCQGHLWPPAALWLTGQARLTTPLLLYPDGHLTLLRPIH